MPARLHHIYDGLVAVMHDWTPQVVSLEKAFVAHNVQSALRLGEARGIALLAAAQAGLRVAEYNPTEIKTAVTGYGRAGKLQIQKAVIDQLVCPNVSANDIPSSPDATDALAVAMCHCSVARIPEALRVTHAARRRMRTTRLGSVADRLDGAQRKK